MTTLRIPPPPRAHRAPGRTPRPSLRRAPRKAELFSTLASLLESGFPLAPALDVLHTPTSRCTRAPRAGRAGRRPRSSSPAALLRSRILAGESLSSAAASEPRWFSSAEAEALRAGESAGAIAPVLRSLAARLDRGALARAHLLTIMLYPALVLALTLVVAGVLGRVALPRLAGTLTEAGLPVPPLTRAIIELTRAGTTPAPWLLLSLGALAVMTAGILARARGYALPPPPILRDAHMSEWAASIAQLLQCGLTLPSAIRGSAQSLSGPWARSCANWLASLASRLERGEPLPIALFPSRWLDPIASARLRAAASAGDLAPALTRLASSRAESVQRRAKRFGAVLEPLVIVVLSLVVGVVVFSAVQPLARLNQLSGNAP